MVHLWECHSTCGGASAHVSDGITSCTVSTSQQSLLIIPPCLNIALLECLVPRGTKTSLGRGASFSTCTRKNAPLLTLSHLVGMVMAERAVYLSLCDMRRVGHQRGHWNSVFAATHCDELMSLTESQRMSGSNKIMKKGYM